MKLVINKESFQKVIGRKRKTTEEFIEQAQKIHENKYSYDKAVYTGANDIITITCKDHGDFEQTPHRHLLGKGCSSCGLARRKKNRASTTENFVEEVKKVHSDKYSYDKVDYVNNYTKVIITCPIHGDFQQRPADHKKGNTCPECAQIIKTDYHKNNPTGWSYTSWETQGKISKDFEGFSLYLIECTSRSTGEKFLKVGKTFKNVAKRFSSDSDMPYMFRVLNQVYHNAFAISKLEEAVKKEFKDYKYEPKKEFAGRTECLSVECLDKVLLFINDKEAYYQNTEKQENKE